jgi:hypothetical protein
VWAGFGERAGSQHLPLSSAPDAVEDRAQFAVVDVVPFLDRVGALGLRGASKLDVVKVFAVQGDLNVTTHLALLRLAHDGVLGDDPVLNRVAVLHVKASTDKGSDLLEDGVGNLSVLLSGVHLLALQLAGLFRSF